MCIFFLFQVGFCFCVWAAAGMFSAPLPPLLGRRGAREDLPPPPPLYLRSIAPPYYNIYHFVNKHVRGIYRSPWSRCRPVCARCVTACATEPRREENKTKSTTNR